MIVFSKVADVQSRITELKRKYKTIGFIPTMGALHKGHVSLMKKAMMENDITVVSIFVNPAQFGPKEDFAHYPRPFDADCALLSEVGIQCLFHPSADDIYPNGFENATQVYVPNLSTLWCGKTRPQLFGGVCSVVCRLLNIVSPTKAYFGQKDFQQLVLIQRMVKDLHMPVQIISGDTIREIDGLACSSRNAYLTEAERKIAPALHKALQDCDKLFKSGVTNTPEILAKAKETHLNNTPIQLDYFTIVDPDTLAEVPIARKGCRVLIAGYLGTTRLIDNLGLGAIQK